MVGSQLNWIRLEEAPLPGELEQELAQELFFLRMLFEEAELAYAKVACCCMVEKPRWLSFVLRAVGLRGEGDSGVRGDMVIVMATGDLRDRTGRDVLLVEAAAMLKESLGLAARAAYIMSVVVCDRLRVC